MEYILILILINVMVLGMTYYIYFKYEIYTPLAMGFLILVLSFCLAITKMDENFNERFFKNNCMLCDEIIYSKEQNETDICNKCKELVKGLKESAE